MGPIDTGWLDALLAELKSAMAKTQLPLDGLEDFLRLDVREKTRADVQERLSGLNGRREKIEQAITAAAELLAAVAALLADGYPDLRPAGVSAGVREDLDAQKESITAALALFAVAATAVDVTLGDERPTSAGES